MIEITLPTHLVMGKRNPKKVPLNLNHYRNAHPATLNNMKIMFKEIVKTKLPKHVFTEPIKITYTLYIGSLTKVDISNVLSIVDKYFQDALSELGVIKDDNWEHVKEVNFKFGGLDRSNPRVKAQVEVYVADHIESN